MNQHVVEMTDTLVFKTTNFEFKNQLKTVCFCLFYSDKVSTTTWKHFGISFTVTELILTTVSLWFESTAETSAEKWRETKIFNGKRRATC